MSVKAVVFDFGNVLGFFYHGKTLQKLAEHTDHAHHHQFSSRRSTDRSDRRSGQLSFRSFFRTATGQRRQRRRVQ